MRISELSELTGVSIASIKYYVREGLLPGGSPEGRNQTDYTDSHAARLRLIRAFLDVGGLSVSASRAVLAALDDEVPFGVAASVASAALPTAAPRTGPTGPGRATLDALTAKLGWTVDAQNPGMELASRVIDDYTALGREDLLSTLDPYANAALQVAEADLDAVAASGNPEAMAETVVIGTVLGDSLLAGLRRMAHEHLTRTRFPVPPEAFDSYHPERKTS
ncbi:MAG: MerR family transcriptional regulator [Pseudolysinimonas sp.]